MRQVQYAMLFRGTAESAGEGMLRASTTCPSTRIESKVGPDGVTSEIGQIGGGEARFSSEVRLTSDSTMTETGTIDFGNGNSFTFSTVGEGHLGPAPDGETTHGCVMWKLESGTGQFDGASGYVTSNFTLSANMQVEDFQFGVVWVN